MTGALWAKRGEPGVPPPDLVHCPRLRPLLCPCISYTNQASYQSRCTRLASSLRHSQQRDMRSLALICYPLPGRLRACNIRHWTQKCWGSAPIQPCEQEYQLVGLWPPSCLGNISATPDLHHWGMTVYSDLISIVNTKRCPLSLLKRKESSMFSMWVVSFT